MFRCAQVDGSSASRFFVLTINAATRNLAQELLLHVGLPAKAAVDAVHIATAALNKYKSFLPSRLNDVFRKQHPSVELRSIELLGTPNCDLGGMRSPDNQDHLIVDTVRIPLELRIHFSTTGDDLHELVITLVFNATDVQTTPQITSDMFIRNHRVE